MSNPWMPDQWNLTAQGQYVLEHGLVKAQEAAAEAGTTVGGKPKPSEQRPIERHWILRKQNTSSGGGLGSSGTGAP